MDEKLYNAVTRTGFVLMERVSLSYLRTKFVFSLNDLINTDILQPGQKLQNTLEIKTELDLYSSLTEKKSKEYLVTIQRVV